jgi:hypothetical protein
MPMSFTRRRGLGTIVSNLAIQFKRKLWWITSPIAYWIYRRTHRYTEPNRCLKGWLNSFVNGLDAGCWTHVCGHDLKYSLKIAMIWWNPKP